MSDIQNAKIIEKNQDAWIYVINKYVKKMNGKTILDVGCGLGGFGIASKKMGAKFVGIDISNEIYRARQMASGQLELLKSDGRDIPFKSNVFDIVVSIGTLEHIKNPDRFVAEMLRVLKPKGFIFLFYGPNRKFHWLDNPDHKKIVCTYLTYEDIYDGIGPIMENVNLVWTDIIEYRLRNKYIPNSASRNYKYYDYLQSIFNIIGKNSYTIKLACAFCRMLEKISYQPNIAIIGQKKY